MTAGGRKGKSSDDADDRRCRVPIAIGHYWDAARGEAVVRPLSAAQLRDVLDQSYSAAEQQLHQPGIGDTKLVRSRHTRVDLEQIEGLQWDAFPLPLLHDYHTFFTRPLIVRSDR